MTPADVGVLISSVAIVSNAFMVLMIMQWSDTTRRNGRARR